MYSYDLTKEKDKPLYESLYENIKNDILSGRLKYKDRLPSKRLMAEKNKISLTTVLNAYNHLIMEGYIISIEKKGYFVSDIKAMPTKEKIIKKEEKILYEEDKWLLDFHSNNALYEFFPFSTWKKVIRSVLSDYEEKLIERGNPFGNKKLREEISKYLYRNRGIVVSPELIVIGAGIEFLYNRLISILPKTSIYAIENPGYKKIVNIYDIYNLKWTSVDMDNNGISISDINNNKADIIHVSPEHHYPLGTLMPMKRRQELLSWADCNTNRYIIEDDFDCEFRYGIKPIPALKSMDINGKVIYMNTFSKTLSPAIRISYMVLPKKLMQKYIDTTNFFTNSTSNLEQLAVAHFIEKGYFERHLNRIKKIYYKEGETLIKILKENKELPIKKISEGDNGTHILVTLDTDIPDKIIKDKASKLLVNVSFLSDYTTKPDRKYNHTMILNFSTLDEKVQREAIHRIGKIFIK